jgi:hypothetical protein
MPSINQTGFGNSPRNENDSYETPEELILAILERETVGPIILEPACGSGNIVKILRKSNYGVIPMDIVDYGVEDQSVGDFLTATFDGIDSFDTVITNPPYSKALEFVKKSLELVADGNKVIMFLRLLFLEGQKRYEFFKENPPVRIYVFSNRVSLKENAKIICFSWFVWEKGFKGDPIIKFINLNEHKKRKKKNE